MSRLAEWAMNTVPPPEDRVKRDALEFIADFLTVVQVYDHERGLADAMKRLAKRAQAIVEREQA